MCVRKASVQSKHRTQELTDFRFRDTEDHEDVKLTFYLDSELFIGFDKKHLALYSHYLIT